MSKASLDRPISYRITLPGRIELNQFDWIVELEVSYEGDPPVTILTGILDQAALHGLLRRIYSLGLPVISIVHLEDGQGEGG